MAGPASVPGVDPSQVSTPGELADCLNGLRLRRGLSYEAMEKAAKLPARSGGSRLEALPKSTVGEIVTGKRLPSKGKLLAFLMVCGITQADLAQWLSAWERASTADLARPVGAVRVRDARPRLLGVHAAIVVGGVPDDVPPQYVPRDADAGELGIRARIEAAARTGGFVLLVGSSSVDKTRCAFEAVKTLVPDWWLVHPAGPAQLVTLAQAPTAPMVVWLDELQRYLGGEHGLTGGRVRALLTASHPVIIIGTMWPDLYNAYAALPAAGGADPLTREREVLDLAAVVRIGPEFSPAEQDRARAAAARDPRLKAALEVSGYGLTQTLAAAPQLVARWQDAQAAYPYARAVLTAALDAARLGVRAPLSADLLRSAAPGYCTARQKADSPEDWFEQALDYATAKLHGAAAALAPAGSGMGQVDGYTPAEYLVQHVARERQGAPIPASTWDALLAHVSGPADAARLADSAMGRLLYCYALPLYRSVADPTKGYAYQLANLLTWRGDVEELRALADAGDGYAAGQLASLLYTRGDLDEVRALADAGNGQAASLMAMLVDARDGLDEAVRLMRAWADAGTPFADAHLTQLLARRGDLDELRTRADDGHQFDAGRGPRS